MLCAFVTACTDPRTPTPIPPVSQGVNPYAPQTGDAALLRGEIKIVSSSLDTQSLPGQAVLKFDYFPPTPCHRLRVEISQADASHRIGVTAYSLIEPNRVCTLMQLATPQHASLTLTGYPAGTYSLWLNNTAVSDWTIP
jgi:hypothetical protein